MIEFLNWGAEHPWLFLLFLMACTSSAWALGFGLGGLLHGRRG